MTKVAFSDTVSQSLGTERVKRTQQERKQTGCSVQHACPTTKNTWKVWNDGSSSSIAQRNGGGGSSCFYWLSEATMHTLLQGVLVEKKHSQPSARVAGEPGTWICYSSTVASRPTVSEGAPSEHWVSLIWALREPHLSMTVRDSQNRRICRQWALSRRGTDARVTATVYGCIQCNKAFYFSAIFFFTFLQCHKCIYFCIYKCIYLGQRQQCPVKAKWLSSQIVFISCFYLLQSVK